MNKYVKSRDGILISPSVSTGVDLRRDLLRLNVIIKAPFANTTSRIEKLRYQLDQDYYYFRALLVLVQMLGRGMRDPKDWCRNVLLDSDVGWLYGGNKHHCADDFRIQYVDSVRDVLSPIPGERRR